MNLQSDSWTVASIPTLGLPPSFLSAQDLLKKAVFQKNFDLAERFLKSDSKINWSITSPLIQAVQSNESKKEIIEFLLRQGADINAL